MRLSFIGSPFKSGSVFIFLVFLCLINAGANSFPTDHLIKNVVQPVRLNRDTTTLILTDFFVSPEKIDSITGHPGLQWSWHKLSYTLSLTSVGNQPPIQDVKFWSGGFPYSVLLKKSEKELYKLSFDPKGRECQSVGLAGDINGWNPKQTPFRLNTTGKWEASIELNPGTYQYQLVVDGKWMIDPANPDSADNNSGGFNSVFKAGKDNSKAPVLQSINTSPGGFTFQCISTTSNPTVKVYWQNFLLGDKFIRKEGQSYQVTIPADAKNFERSFIRVYACDEINASNDLLIPLQSGQVLTDAAKLTRNDKEANSIYFVLVDRFFNGDSANDQKVIHPEIKPKANYYGGDLAGVLQKINSGYFQSLYLNSLWISPIVQNPETAYKEFPEPHDWYSGYHGYWPISLTGIDHRFGNDRILTDLVQAAHKNHINVLLDLVANHVHEDYPLILKHPEWRTALNLPDGRKNIRLWDEQRLTTWFDSFLPTLDFSKKEVVKLEVDSSVYWIKKFDLDGFRHDATKHIPEHFWRALTIELKKLNKPLYQLGETYGSKELIGSYIGSGMMDGQFDFNLYFDARSVFAKDNVDFKVLTETLRNSMSYYGSHHLMGNISGNHDLPRFASLAGGALSFSENERLAGWQREVGVGNDIAYSKLACHLAFIATIPGVPVLYYGDEIAMPGAGDPDNRRMMKFDGLTEREAALKKTTAELFNYRSHHLSLIYGDFKWNKVEKDVLAYSRSYFKETTTVVFNNRNEAADVSVNLEGLPRQKVQNLFGNKFERNGNHLSVKLPPKSFEVFTLTAE